MQKIPRKKLTARNFESEKEGKHSDQTTEFTHLVILNLCLWKKKKEKKL